MINEPVANYFVENSFGVRLDECVDTPCNFANGNRCIVYGVVFEVVLGDVEAFPAGAGSGFVCRCVFAGKTLVGDINTFLDVIDNELLSVLPALGVNIVVPAQVGFGLFETVLFALWGR